MQRETRGAYFDRFAIIANSRANPLRQPMTSTPPTSLARLNSAVWLHLPTVGRPTTQQTKRNFLVHFPSAKHPTIMWKMDVAKTSPASSCAYVPLPPTLLAVHTFRRTRQEHAHSSSGGTVSATKTRVVDAPKTDQPGKPDEIWRSITVTSSSAFYYRLLRPYMSVYGYVPTLFFFRFFFHTQNSNLQKPVPRLKRFWGENFWGIQHAEQRP